MTRAGGLARDWSTWATAVVAAAALALISTSVYFARSNSDEGWYLHASRLVMQGKIPYRDFGYFQTPLIPYLYGVPQRLFGSGLEPGRWTSAAYGTLVLALGSALLVREGARRWVPLFLAIVAFNPIVLELFASVRAEVVESVFAVLAVWCLWRPPAHPSARIAALPFVLLLGAAARLSFLPAAIVAIAYTLPLTEATWRQRALAVATILALFGVLFVLPVVLSGDRYFFNVWTAQRDRGASVPFAEALHSKVATASFALIALTMVMAPLTLLIALLAMDPRALRAAFGRDQRLRPRAKVAAALVLSALLVAPFFALDRLEPRYFTTLYVIGAVTVAYAAHEAAALGIEQRLLGAVAGVALVIGAPVMVSGYFSEHNLRDPELARVQAAGRRIREMTAPGDRILTFDLRLEQESGRDNVDGLDMGGFSFWAKMSDEDARRRLVVNENRLHEIMASAEPKVVVLDDFTKYALLQQIKAAPAAFPAEDIAFQLLPEMRNRYRLEATLDYATGPQGARNLYLYRRVY